MVIASVAPVVLQKERIIEAFEIPVIDLSWEKREHVAEFMVRACEDFGFFKVINHGVPERLVAELEAESMRFFSLPPQEKQKAAGPAANPLGYGSRSIGFNGDMGELEYLLLHCDPSFVSQRAKTINRNTPNSFSCVVNEYVEQVRELACELLELLGEGLGLEDSGVFPRLLKDTENDSLIRLNHYPPSSSPPPPPPPPPCNSNWNSLDEYNEEIGSISSKVRNSSHKKSMKLNINGQQQQQQQQQKSCRIGFGEHSDPQILSILRSNDVQGLQILLPSYSSAEDDRVWAPVPADPTAFYVNVGDALQALTNGRLSSVRHRAMANDHKQSRLSIIFFGAPPLHRCISPLPEMVTPQRPRRYKPFTWAEFKRTMYSLRLSHNRLDLFRADNKDDDAADNAATTAAT